MEIRIAETRTPGRQRASTGGHQQSRSAGKPGGAASGIQAHGSRIVFAVRVPIFRSVHATPRRSARAAARTARFSHPGQHRACRIGQASRQPPAARRDLRRRIRAFLCRRARAARLSYGSRSRAHVVRPACAAGGPRVDFALRDPRRTEVSIQAARRYRNPRPHRPAWK